MAVLPRPRAFAFDLDGTLIDSRRDIAAACNHVLVHAGRSPLSEAEIATYVGDGAVALLARAFRIPPDAAELRPLHHEFVRYYGEHAVTRTAWMPGALEALDALAAYPMAVVTNKTRTVTMTILEALGAAGRFAFTYGAGDGPLKPSPQPILAVTRALGVRASELWVVGDGPQDVGAGRAAGSPTIGVLGGFQPEEHLRLAAPDRVIGSLSDLVALVRESNAASRPDPGSNV